MTVERIKKKMLAYKDFYGGDLFDTDAINNAETKTELYNVIEKHRSHMEDMLCDANSHLDNFKKQLGLHIL